MQSTSHQTVTGGHRREGRRWILYRVHPSVLTVKLNVDTFNLSVVSACFVNPNLSSMNTYLISLKLNVLLNTFKMNRI